VEQLFSISFTLSTAIACPSGLISLHYKATAGPIPVQIVYTGVNFGAG
jgi:hypothetical protein